MKDFPSNINPELFTITGIIVGLILEDDYTAAELNSIGNWLILVGQIVLTTAAQQQLINSRFQNNLGSRIKSDANNHKARNPEYVSYDGFNQLYAEIRKLRNDIEKMKKNTFK